MLLQLITSQYHDVVTKVLHSASLTLTARKQSPGTVIDFSQVRIRTDNGNYETSSFLRVEEPTHNRAEQPKLITTGYDYLNFEYVKVKSKSEVVTELDYPDLTSRTISLRGLTFSQANKPLNTLLFESINASIIDYTIRLTAKNQGMVAKYQLKTLPGFENISLDDLYEITVLVSIYDMTEDKVDQGIAALTKNSACNGLNVESTNTGKQRFIKLYREKVRNYISLIRDPLRVTENGSSTKEDVALNWFIRSYEYLNSDKHHYFDSITPLYFRARFDEEVAWSPFHSHANYNVVAIPSQCPLGHRISKLRLSLEQLLMTNRSSLSARLQAYVPIERYKHLSKIETKLEVNNRWVFNIDPLPKMVEWKGDRYNYDTCILHFFHTLFNVSVDSIQDKVTKELISNHLKNISWMNFIFQLIDNGYYTTLGVLDAMKSSEDQRFSRLAWTVFDSIPEIHDLYSATNPNLFDSNVDLVIDSLQLQGSCLQQVLGISMLTHLQLSQSLEKPKPTLHLIETTFSFRPAEEFASLLRMNRKFAIATIFVQPNYADCGQALHSREIMDQTQCILREDQENLHLESEWKNRYQNDALPPLMTE
ncbi:hypothetical protein OH460_08480 [Vibrio sp. Makdt]|uniref:hypothetical protein n=1 Tax=Vibrio sp. Makdt TaxID=2998828 RepID=UPI0022CDA92A|nr:hypothetical protein [Vibrio sp. Makdt]MDA0152336.1 hypothetical protein [Vibrio sp. Makdt]